MGQEHDGLIEWCTGEVCMCWDRNMTGSLSGVQVRCVCDGTGT